MSKEKILQNIPVHYLEIIMCHILFLNVVVE